MGKRTSSYFKSKIKRFYKKNKRDFPWRNTVDPYRILVSEIMLQQTQVTRVTQKYPEFLKVFPTIQRLAKAPIKDILKVWQGMGYNRRALYLKKIAELVIENYHGRLPDDPQVLETFPGIGHATARSIAVFAWNKPTVFIETNIRRVFIHFFFNDNVEIDDKHIYLFVEKTLDKKSPREWYWALMDYGTYLAKKVPNPNRKSKHYVRQSAFEGSRRQLRGLFLKSILKKQISVKDKRFNEVAEVLKKEGFIREEDGHYVIT